MKIIFERNDKVLFLKEGSCVNINGTDFKFRLVASGTVINDQNGKGYYIVRDDKNPETTYNVLQPFSPEEEESAQKIAKEMNSHFLEIIKIDIKAIEENYL